MHVRRLTVLSALVAAIVVMVPAAALAAAHGPGRGPKAIGQPLKATHRALEGTSTGINTVNLATGAATNESSGHLFHFGAVTGHGISDNHSHGSEHPQLYRLRGHRCGERRPVVRYHFRDGKGYIQGSRNGEDPKYHHRRNRPLYRRRGEVHGNKQKHTHLYCWIDRDVCFHQHHGGTDQLLVETFRTDRSLPPRSPSDAETGCRGLVVDLALPEALVVRTEVLDSCVSIGA